MGIPGIRNFFECVLKKKMLSELKGKKMLIDGIHVLYRQCIGRRGAGKELQDDHLKAIFMFTMGLLEKGIMPIYVFDGGSPPEKAGTVEERKLNKKKAFDKCSKIPNKSSEEYIRNFKRCFHIDPRQIEESKQLLKYMGIPVVQALMEADVQLAAMSNKYKHIISGVLTEDSDVLVYGGTTIYKDFSFRTNSVVELNRYEMFGFLCDKINRIRKEKSLSLISNFTHSNFVDFAIMMGTDYRISRSDNLLQVFGLSNVEKHEKVFELFAINDMNVEKTIEYMHNENFCENNISGKDLYGIPEDYIESWRKIKEIYLESDVIDPEDTDFISLEMKHPDSKKIKEMLCDIEDFDEGLIDSKIRHIINNFRAFEGITQQRAYSNPFDSFSSYQHRYYANKMNRSRRSSNKIYNNPICVH